MSTLHRGHSRAEVVEVGVDPKTGLGFAEVNAGNGVLLRFERLPVDVVRACGKRLYQKDGIRIVLEVEE